MMDGLRSTSRFVCLSALLLCASCMPDDPASSGGDTLTPAPTTAAATLVVNAADPAACNIPGRFRHATRHHGERTVLHGGDAILFRSPYAVNTDGAPNSYHPDDPYGSQGLAINTICNGANATSAAGVRYNYSQCRQLVEVFREARASGWNAPGGARMNFYGVAATGPGNSVPCVNPAAPYAGYFVSSTSLAADPRQSSCDQGRYLNALDTNFIIRPNSRAFSNAGMRIGDLALVYHPPSGRMAYAIVGDTGPSWGLGEGSVALVRTLGAHPRLPQSRADVNRMGLQDVVTLVFPGTGLRAPITQARIDAAGAVAFAEFGGPERFAPCLEALRQRQ